MLGILQDKDARAGEDHHLFGMVQNGGHFAAIGLLHFLFDFVPLILLQFVLYPLLPYMTAIIIVEGLLGVFAVLFVLLAYFLWKREGGPPELDTDAELT